MYSSLSIHKRLKSLWRATRAWPDYIDALQMALVATPSTTDQPQIEHQPWLLLPGLCCQAAGGNPSQAEPLAAAWGLLYTTAHLLDSVEDNTFPDNFHANWEAGPLVNVATGLLVSAFLALSDLRCYDVAEAVVAEIAHDFYHSLLQMCSGQHRDLTQPQPSLEACWQVAGAKSGVFFALACRAGARLATDAPEQLNLYSKFGHHLGLLIQIGDDIDGLWSKQGAPSDLIAGSKWTLPIAYAMTVSPPEFCVQLSDCLETARRDPIAESRARQLIEETGAIIYLAIEAERHRRQARLALEKTCSLPGLHDKLAALLNNVIPLLSG